MCQLDVSHYCNCTTFPEESWEHKTTNIQCHCTELPIAYNCLYLTVLCCHVFTVRDCSLLE